MENGIKIQELDFKKLNPGELFNRSTQRYEYFIEFLASKLVVSDEKFEKFIAGKRYNHQLLINIAEKFSLSISTVEIRYENTI